MNNEMEHKRKDNIDRNSHTNDQEQDGNDNNNEIHTEGFNGCCLDSESIYTLVESRQFQATKRNIILT